MGGVIYKPERYSKEFKEHMNSPKVVEAHKKMLKDVKEYQQDKFKKMEKERGY